MSMKRQKLVKKRNVETPKAKRHVDINWKLKIMDKLCWELLHWLTDPIGGKLSRVRFALKLKKSVNFFMPDFALPLMPRLISLSWCSRHISCISERIYLVIILAPVTVLLWGHESDSDTCSSPLNVWIN